MPERNKEIFPARLLLNLNFICFSPTKVYSYVHTYGLEESLFPGMYYSYLSEAYLAKRVVEVGPWVCPKTGITGEFDWEYYHLQKYENH